MPPLDDKANQRESTTDVHPGNPGPGGKKRIVRDLCDHGFSNKRARTVLNAVLAAIKKGLVADQEVETSIGAFVARQHDGTEAVVKRCTRNIHTGQLCTVVSRRPGKRLVVSLKPDPKIDCRTPEQQEQDDERNVRDLARRLLSGREPDDRVMAALHRRREQTGSTRGELIGCLNRLLKRDRMMTSEELVAQAGTGLGCPIERDWHKIKDELNP